MEENTREGTLMTHPTFFPVMFEQRFFPDDGEQRETERECVSVPCTGMRDDRVTELLTVLMLSEVKDLDRTFMNHIKQRLGSGSGMELLLPHGDLLRPVKADEEGEKGNQDRGKRGLKWRKLQTKPRPPRGRRSEPAVRPGLHFVRNLTDRHGDIDFGRSAINDRHGSSGLIELMSRKHRESSIM
ncbi:nuclear factor Y [Striga asiatica]|uniref:Nuclear factor Y n=1 Tax=Striga asiatica TaxID=4170 RepID=A0A5A7Q757_STRAF|nr:nuclear factor Y [Striga asiatica]